MSDSSQHLWFKVIISILYITIFLVGVSSNLMTLFVMLRNKSMRTTTNLFLANLAVVDIFVCLLVLPFTPLSVFVESWSFGAVFCHLVPMLVSTSVYVSTFTLASVVIVRYLAITYPDAKVKVFVPVLVIVATWIVAALLTLPIAIYQVLVLVEYDNIYICYENWPSSTSRCIFNIIQDILRFVLPYVAIITGCLLVSRVINRHTLPSPKDQEATHLDVGEERKTNRMLIVLASVYLCCWLPLGILSFVSQHNDTIAVWQHYMRLFFTAHLLAMCSVVYKPFIYIFMNENFRKQLKSCCHL